MVLVSDTQNTMDSISCLIKPSVSQIWHLVDFTILDKVFQSQFTYNGYYDFIEGYLKGMVSEDQR